MGSNFMKRALSHFVAGATLSFVIFVLAPISVHAPNAAEFDEPASRLLLPFIGLFLLGALVVGLISWLASFSSTLLILYLCGSVAGLVLSQIFSSSAGIVIDGGFHEYGVSPVRAAGEILALIMVFLLGFMFRRRIAENRRAVAVTVMLWALASAAMPASYYLRPADELRLPGSLKTFAELSSKLNVLHVMFDSFQSDAFAEVLERSPAIRDELDGFVLLRGAQRVLELDQHFAASHPQRAPLFR